MTVADKIRERAERTAQAAYRLAVMDGEWATSTIEAALREAVAEERQWWEQVIGLTREDILHDNPALTARGQEAAPKPPGRILHLITQDNQPYGSRRLCCEMCGAYGTIISGRGGWTDDRALYTTSSFNCQAAPKPKPLPLGHEFWRSPGHEQEPDFENICEDCGQPKAAHRPKGGDRG